MARILPPLVAVLLFLSLSSLSDGLIHHISVSDDTRSVFRLETFGFFEGGLISLSVTGFKVPLTIIVDLPLYSRVAIRLVARHRVQLPKVHLLSNERRLTLALLLKKVMRLNA